MKNDQVYIVNGLRAVFRAKTERGIISTYPIAEFTFEDGEQIKIKYVPLSQTYRFIGGEIDLDIYYEGGVWKLKS
ncbi:hypothetical protein VMC263_102 [Klebsiella phage ValerieMcCarty03]|nr:hypothetical protein VMC263_102 [Klebsiella phage ValerieMcCarty03]CAK6606124.1 unknown function [Klebsiella phage vB_Kte_K65PH164]